MFLKRLQYNNSCFLWNGYMLFSDLPFSGTSFKKYLSKESKKWQKYKKVI